MNDFILWALAIIPITIFSAISIGVVYATVYDWWHWRKYGFWVMLKEDHSDNNPPGPLAK